MGEGEIKIETGVQSSVKTVYSCQEFQILRSDLLDACESKVFGLFSCSMISNTCSVFSLV